MFDKESRHLLDLSVQNALDCISENLNHRFFPGGAYAGNSLEKCAVRSPDGRYHAYILPLYNISLGPLYHKIFRPFLKTKWSKVQSCCPFKRKTENYWRNSLTIIIWNSISFIEFNQKSIQNDGSTLLGRPLNLLVAKLRVNLRGSSNRMWSNLIAIRVDTQLKNGFGFQLLFRQRVLKTTELQEQYKKHVTTSRTWYIWFETYLSPNCSYSVFFNWFEIKTGCYPNYMIKIL